MAPRACSLSSTASHSRKLLYMGRGMSEQHHHGGPMRSSNQLQFHRAENARHPVAISRPLHLVVLTATLLIAATACAEDPSTPTGPGAQPSVPVSPVSPPPPPPPPTLGTNRRSFIWSEERGYIILPNPPGVILVSANAINGRGEVAGTVIMDRALGGPPYRAFKWSEAGGFKFIPGPATVNVYGMGLDDDGNVVGYTEAGNVREAFIWSDVRGLRPLNIRLPREPTLGIHAGRVFGNALIPGNAVPYRLDIASDRFEQLQALSEEGGGVLDVNGLGEAVGYDGNVDYGFGGTSDAVMWDKAGTRTVAFSCNGKDDCFASLNAINANGVTVGSVTTGELRARRVFRWSRSTGVEYIDLPPGDANDTDVADVADDGSILAYNGLNGFIFSQSGGVTVIRPPATHRLVRPWAMNQQGQVVGMVF